MFIFIVTIGTIIVITVLVFGVDFLTSWDFKDSLFYKYFYSTKKKAKLNWEENLPKSAYFAYKKFPYLQMPQTTFQEFIQYYSVNPDAWYVDDECQISVYRCDKYNNPLFLLFYPFEEYWKFSKWYTNLKEENTKNAEAKKQRELEQKQTKEKIALLELVQKDIDALKAQSERELATAREMTEEVKKNLEERVGD